MRIMRMDRIVTEFGTAKINKNGYYVIITSKEGNNNKYLHRLIFEKYYGPIPEGFVIHHEDGDKLNNCLFNLQLMRRSEHNHNHHKGRKHSDETRAKISEFHKGKTLSAEHRAKISKSCKGRKFSDETLKKISESHKGKTLSEEHRRKISKSRKKYDLWNGTNCWYHKNVPEGGKYFRLAYKGRYIPIGGFNDFTSVELISDLIKEEEV